MNAAIIYPRCIFCARIRAIKKICHILLSTLQSKVMQTICFYLFVTGSGSGVQGFSNVQAVKPSLESACHIPWCSVTFCMIS